MANAMPWLPLTGKPAENCGDRCGEDVPGQAAGGELREVEPQQRRNQKLSVMFGFLRVWQCRLRDL